MTFWPRRRISTVARDQFRFGTWWPHLAADPDQCSSKPLISTNRFPYFDPFLQTIAQSALLAYRSAQSLATTRL